MLNLRPYNVKVEMVGREKDGRYYVFGTVPTIDQTDEVFFNVSCEDLEGDEPVDLAIEFMNISSFNPLYYPYRKMLFSQLVEMAMIHFKANVNKTTKAVLVN